MSSAIASLAREEYGREIQVWTNAYVVQGETEEDAKKFFDYYVHEKGDWVAVDNLTTTLGINAQTMPPEVAHQLKAHFIAGWAGYPIVGTKEKVVDELATLVARRLRRRHSVMGEVRRADARISERSRIRWWCRRGCARAQGFIRPGIRNGHAVLYQGVPFPGSERPCYGCGPARLTSRSARKTLL